jgi:hypothetical protein
MNVHARRATVVEMLGSAVARVQQPCRVFYTLKDSARSSTYNDKEVNRIHVNVRCLRHQDAGRSGQHRLVASSGRSGETTSLDAWRAHAKLCGSTWHLS